VSRNTVRSRLGRRGAGYVAAFLAGAVLFGALGVALGAGGLRLTSNSDGTPIYSVKPTGVGLPLVGAHGTVGAGDYAPELKSYHDSGAYKKDLIRVDSQAQAYLADRLKVRHKRCKGRPSSARGCKKPALVLDIDETSLSNYANIAKTNFTNVVAGLATGVAKADDPPIRPTLELYEFAQRKHVAIFFITGRPSTIPVVQERTEENLKAAGYKKWAGLSLNPGEMDTVPYKSGERAKIQKAGYRILVNVGDQESDLQGGHAQRAFKLPNPYYFIGP